MPTSKFDHVPRAPHRHYWSVIYVLGLWKTAAVLEKKRHLKCCRHLCLETWILCPISHLNVEKRNPCMFTYTGILNFQAEVCEHFSFRTSSFRWNFPDSNLAFSKDGNTFHVTLKFGAWLTVILKRRTWYQAAHLSFTLRGAVLLICIGLKLSKEIDPEHSCTAMV